MVRVTVSVLFEAADAAEAEALIQTWTLHEGCRVSSFVSAPLAPQEGLTNADGKVVASPALAAGEAALAEEATQ